MRNNDNIRTVLADMPTTISAYTILADDYYTVIINSRLTKERQIKAYTHELRHIQNGDFDRMCSVGLIEFYTHKEDKYVL